MHIQKRQNNIRASVNMSVVSSFVGRLAFMDLVTVSVMEKT